jgi:hypothetical protein
MAYKTTRGMSVSILKNKQQTTAQKAAGALPHY